MSSSEKELETISPMSPPGTAEGATREEGEIIETSLQDATKGDDSLNSIIDHGPADSSSSSKELVNVPDSPASAFSVGVTPDSSFELVHHSIDDVVSVDGSSHGSPTISMHPFLPSSISLPSSLVTFPPFASRLCHRDLPLIARDSLKKVTISAPPPKSAVVTTRTPRGPPTSASPIRSRAASVTSLGRKFSTSSIGSSMGSLRVPSISEAEENILAAANKGRRASHDGVALRSRISKSPLLAPIPDNILASPPLNPTASSFAMPHFPKRHWEDQDVPEGIEAILKNGKNEHGDLTKEARGQLARLGLKAIPSMHGPSSLPYARCPSGIDAFLYSAEKDEDAYAFIVDTKPRQRAERSQVALPGNARYSQGLQVNGHRIVSAPAVLEEHHGRDYSPPLSTTTRLHQAPSKSSFTSRQASSSDRVASNEWVKKFTAEQAAYNYAWDQHQGLVEIPVAPPVEPSPPPAPPSHFPVPQPLPPTSFAWPPPSMPSPEWPFQHQNGLTAPLPFGGGFIPPYPYMVGIPPPPVPPTAAPYSNPIYPIPGIPMAPYFTQPAMPPISLPPPRTTQEYHHPFLPGDLTEDEDHSYSGFYFPPLAASQKTASTFAPSTIASSRRPSTMSQSTALGGSSRRPSIIPLPSVVPEQRRSSIAPPLAEPSAFARKQSLVSFATSSDDLKWGLLGGMRRQSVAPNWRAPHSVTLQSTVPVEDQWLPGLNTQARANEQVSVPLTPVQALEMAAAQAKRMAQQKQQEVANKENNEKRNGMAAIGKGSARGRGQGRRRKSRAVSGVGQAKDVSDAGIGSSA